MLFYYAWYLSMVFYSSNFRFFGPFWREWGYVTINAQLPFIYGGRNNNVLDHIWWNFSYEGQNGGNNGGIMMYNYGLDHRELGEQFFVLAQGANGNFLRYLFLCEGKSVNDSHLASVQGVNSLFCVYNFSV